MNQPLSPKVLVAPLDWGLGHATRCIPIIQELIRAGCTVFIAAEGKVKALLEAEFPQLRFLHLPGYNIRYASTAWEVPFKIVAQIPGIIRTIKNEQRWLQKVVQHESIDAVISDNRFGLHPPKIHSVFITHQLRIKAPLKSIETILQKLNYHYINKFTECWIPDAEDENNLAGVLSHPAIKPKITLRYLGALSRFKKNGCTNEAHLLIILSGPEPQRTLLEKQLLGDLKNYTAPVVLVRGLPEATDNLQTASNISVYNHLPAQQLEEVMCTATFIISRCGYSTVMDIAALQKRSILIPTPGQTEQEYLAAYLMKKNFALCVEQKKFRLKNALELAEHFAYEVNNFRNNNTLREAVQNLLASVKTESIN